MSVRNSLLCACIIAGTWAAPHFVMAQEIYVDTAPPPPHEETVPEARTGYVWSPGYWAWQNDTHVWVQGRWIEERPQAHWVPDHWEKQDPHWHFVGGHWDNAQQ